MAWGPVKDLSWVRPACLSCCRKRTERKLSVRPRAVGKVTRSGAPAPCLMAMELLVVPKSMPMAGDSAGGRAVFDADMKFLGYSILRN